MFRVFALSARTILLKESERGGGGERRPFRCLPGCMHMRTGVCVRVHVCVCDFRCVYHMCVHVYGRDLVKSKRDLV